MKKVIVIISSIILCLSTSSIVYLAIQYNNHNKTKEKDIKVVEEKIKNTSEEITKKKDEIEKIKKENTEKVELLETWKKELVKVKKDS